MSRPDTFSIEPWAIPEPVLHLDRLGQTESVFALSNGHIGLRGNLDEGEPHAVPGSYLNGFFETLPLPHAEAGYGYPEEGQSLIDVTNGKVIRLLVDDEPFDVRYGVLERHERRLDLRDGVLHREVVWTSPAGRTVRVRSTRLVSFVQRSVAAISYEVESLDQSARIVVQSTLVANEPVPVPAQADDPRAAAALRAPLVAEYHRHHDLQGALGHHTRGVGSAWPPRSITWSTGPMAPRSPRRAPRISLGSRSPRSWRPDSPSESSSCSRTDGRR